MKFHRTLTALFLALALTFCFVPTTLAADEAPPESGFTLDLSWLTDGIGALWDAVTSGPDPSPSDETNGCVVPIGCAAPEATDGNGEPTDEAIPEWVPIG